MFSKMIFRATRGKVLSYFSDNTFTLRDVNNKDRDRLVYVLVFQQGDFLADRVSKICSSFTGKIYNLPEDGHASPNAYNQAIAEVK